MCVLSILLLEILIDILSTGALPSRLIFKVRTEVNIHVLGKD